MSGLTNRLAAWRLLPAVAVGFAVTLVLVAASGLSGSGRQQAPRAAASESVTINSRTGALFAPVSGVLAAKSADEVFAVFAAHNGSSLTATPAGVTAQLGRLTLPIGPCGPVGAVAYHANGQLVWAFSWPSTPPVTFPGEAQPAPSTEWLFLDAATGAEVDQTWQQ